MSIFLYLQNFTGLCTDIKDIAVIRQYFSPQKLSFGGAGETDSKELSIQTTSCDKFSEEKKQ